MMNAIHIDGKLDLIHCTVCNYQFVARWNDLPAVQREYDAHRKTCEITQEHYDAFNNKKSELVQDVPVIEVPPGKITITEVMRLMKERGLPVDPNNLNVQIKCVK